jgi:hypothetical protein
VSGEASSWGGGVGPPAAPPLGARRFVPVDAGLALGQLPADDRLHAVLQGALAARGVARPPPGEASAAPHWDAAYFELPRLAAFAEAPATAQRAIVARCGADLLHEALHIETIGLAYGAKMLLLSETVDERMLYAAIAAEEAAHLAGIAAFAARGPAEGPFLALLGELVAEGDRATLVLVVQVVLEGWGLDHYRGLARACRTPALARVLEGILLDEARHHGSGILLAPRRPAGDAAVEVLTALCDMVRVGPQGVLAAVEAERGPLGRAGRVRALAALDTEAHAGRRLALLRGLLARAGADTIVAALDARGRLTPATAEEAA